MKIAMFSPLPPKETGVALYTENILSHLKDICNIDIYDTDHNYTEFMGMPVRDYATNKIFLAKLHRYDLVVYHIGNNPHFHLPIYHVLCNRPGVVILHDAVIYYLMAGQDEYTFTKDFCINYGFDRIREFDELKRSCLTPNNLLSYPHPERYPMLKTVLDKAEAIIVHSQVAKNLILMHGYKKQIYTIPFLIYKDALNMHTTKTKLLEYRKKYSVSNDTIIIGSFGFIGHTKRLPSIFSALEKIKEKIDFKLLLVGMGVDNFLQQKIDEHHLQSHIIDTGYVSSNEDFFDLMNLSDIVINLRFPSMGETSSIVTQAMFLSKPCIVTGYGWFSELPNEAVCKIPYDESEVESLVNVLVWLSENKAARQNIGELARKYVIENCHPKEVCKKYYQTFKDIIATKMSSDHCHTSDLCHTSESWYPCSLEKNS